MRHKLHHIILIVSAAILMMGCTDHGGTKQGAQAYDIYIWSLVIISLLAITIAVILYSQNREIKRKNQVLAQQLAEALTAKEQAQATHIEKQQTVTPTDNVTDLSTLSDADLFQHLSTIIEREQLFLESTCDRQMLTERFSLPKERIGNAFVRGGGYNNMSAYINILRLEFAAQMLTDRPDLDVSQVAQSSGFISHRYFSTCFKQRFGLSPSDYREASKSV